MNSDKSIRRHKNFPPIYGQLANHQRNEPWDHCQRVSELHAWAERFDVEFKLQISAIVIGVERLGRHTLGQFRRGHNALGLRGEIILDETHVRENGRADRCWRLLGTLLHEMLHAWQQLHGRDSRSTYHNSEFRRKAAELGLLVSREGVTGYVPGSAFFSLLERYGVQVPFTAEPIIRVQEERHGNSKLKLWVCGCPVRVRVAIKDFAAVCLRCGCRFEQA
ncbi:MAG: hypothetical protein ACYC3X_23155 [Pirellulaceae bacterium]